MSVILNSLVWVADGVLSPYDFTGPDTIGSATEDGSLNAGAVFTGGGNDTLTFNTLTSSLLANFEALANGNPVSINLAEGNDALTVYTYQNQSPDVQFIAGSGDDVFQINIIDMSRNGTFDIFMDEGDDRLVLGDWVGTGTIVADGGDDYDTFELLGEISDYGFAASGDDLLVTKGNTGITLTVTNFEAFVVGGDVYTKAELLNPDLGSGTPGSGSGGNVSGGSGTAPGNLVPGGPSTIGNGVIELGIFVDTLGAGNGRGGARHPLPITPGTVKNAFADTFGSGKGPIFIEPVS